VPSFAVDGRGRLYAVWQDARLTGGSREEILLTRSSDGGRHWSAPARISRLSSGRSIIPVIAARGDGSIAVLYLALDAGGTGGRYRVARSADGGRHVTDGAVSTGFAISDAPDITPFPLVPGGHFVGDYMGIAPLAGSGFGAVFVVAHPGATASTDVYYASR
jgi:hypothetical protein